MIRPSSWLLPGSRTPDPGRFCWHKDSQQMTTRANDQEEPTGRPRLATPRAAPSPDLVTNGARCRSRGCVFPAEESEAGLCFYHQRLEQEPNHFCSCQPTLLVLRRALFSAGGSEAAYRRIRDRQRMAAQRAAFQHGLA